MDQLLQNISNNKSHILIPASIERCEYRLGIWRLPPTFGEHEISKDGSPSHGTQYFFFFLRDKVRRSQKRTSQNKKLHKYFIFSSSCSRLRGVGGSNTCNVEDSVYVYCLVKA